jgi:multiple antibiotic resistance protein
MESGDLHAHHVSSDRGRYILVSFRARASGPPDVAVLSLAAVAYAAVTALTIYTASHIERRVSHRTRSLLERIAGILLTAIAVVALLTVP